MRKLLLAFLLLLSLGIPQAASAQGTGFPPYGSFQDGRFDVVNRQNLNANIQIPIGSFPGRGTSFSYGLVYDTLLWRKSGSYWTPNSVGGDFLGWGWKPNAPVGGIQYFVETQWCVVCDTFDCLYMFPYDLYRDYSYYDADGTQHYFGLSFTDNQEAVTNNCAQGEPRTAAANDGSGYFVDATVPTDPFVRSPSGLKITNAGSLFDTNGNMISKIVVSSTKFQYKDTVGRIVLEVEKESSTVIRYRALDVTGNWQTTTVNLGSFQIKTNFGCGGVTEYTGSASLPVSMALPNGQSYSFEYEDTPGFSGYKTGRLKKVTLPTGGSYEYSYPTTNNGVYCSDGSLRGMTRVITGGTSPATWDYTRSQVSGSVWKTVVKAPKLDYDPVSNETVFTFDGTKETSRKVYQGSEGSGTLQRTVNVTWAANGSPASSTVILADTNQQAKTETTFDSFGNLSQIKEYDWGSGTPGSLVRTTTLTYLSTSAYTSRNIRDRVTNITVKNAGGTKKAETIVAYDQGTITSTSGVPQHDYTGYPASFTTRGNPTTTQRWVSGMTYLNTTFTYDDLGNVRSTTDSGSHTTNFSYADNFSDGVNRNTLAYLTQITKPSPFSSQTITAKYVYHTGQVHSATDENGRTTSFTYTDSLGAPDPFNRLRKASFPDGGQIDASYDDPNRKVIATQKRTGSESLTVTEVFNQLGMLVQRQLPGQRKVDFIYDQLGGLWKATNPYIVNTEPTYGLTETQIDALGRVKVVFNQDGTSAQFTYAGNAARVTDESAKKRLTQVDALGRLTRVCEETAGNSRSPAESCGITSFGGTGYLTTHQYDVLDNVIQTTQGTGTQIQTRTATFDGISRILTAGVPEVSTSSTLTYAYDSDGLLAGVTDPRGAVNFEYDELGRLKKKKHGATVVASYVYDGTQANNAIGRLISEIDGEIGSGADKTDYTYDAMGRVKTANRTISGVTYAMSYVYDLMGNLTEISYPSSSGTRRKVQYAYNGAGELNKATDITGTAYDYVAAASYTPHGLVQQMDFGNAVRTIVNSNKRYQLTSLSTQKVGGATHLSLSYAYHANGQIQQITNNLDALQTEKYTYDELLRLLTAQRGPDTNIRRLYTYDYDRFGNRWAQVLDSQSQDPGYGSSLSFNSGNNRVTTTGFSYDTSGNVTNANLGATFAYDQENFLTAAGTTVSYKVDAQGRRVRKTVGSTVTDYFYFGAVVVAEKQGSTWTDYIFFGGQRIAVNTGASLSTAKFIHPDHLGSTRVCTDASGNPLGTCAYEPFGEFRGGATSCSVPTNYRFAGMEWDAETGLYHTWFRKYDPTQGRWLSVDPLPGSEDDPQSLNRYVYVLNDPVNLFDPWGLSCACVEGRWEEVTEVEGWVFVCRRLVCGGGGHVDSRPPCDRNETRQGGLAPCPGGGTGSPGETDDPDKKTLSEIFNCAGRGADRFDVAFLTGSEGTVLETFFTGSVIGPLVVAATEPTAENIKNGAVAAGSTQLNAANVNRATTAVGSIPVGSDIQTLTTTVPAPRLGSTPLGRLVTSAGRGTAALLRVVGKVPTLGFDALSFGINLALCE